MGMAVVESPDSGCFTIAPNFELGEDRAEALVKLGASRLYPPSALLSGPALIQKGAVTKRFPKGTPLRAAKKEAVKRAVSATVFIAVPVAVVCDVPVWERVAKLEVVDADIAALEALEDAEKVLSMLTGERIEKAVDPTSSGGFLYASLRLQNILGGLHRQPDDAHLRKIMDQVAGKNWIESQVRREAVYKMIQNQMPGRSMESFLPRYRAALLADAKTTFRGVKRSVKLKHDLDVSLSLSQADMQAVNNVTSMQYNFIRNSYGKRSDSMSERARKIVSKGLEEGLGPDEIAAELERKLPETYAAKRKNYLQVVAMNFVNRARSRSLMQSYDEAGIKRARVVAVLDEATTEICRALDGSLIPVAGAIALNSKAESLPDPEDVKDTLPWLKQRRTSGGVEIVRPTSGGDVVLGKTTKSGSTMNFSGDALVGQGVAFPPYHAMCRTTTIPE